MTVNIFDMAQTWNNGATTFSGIKLNVTDTASAAASNLMDLQVGGNSKFQVGKNSDVYFDRNNSAAQTIIRAGGRDFFQLYGTGYGVQPLYVLTNGGLRLSTPLITGVGTCVLYSTTNLWEQRNGTNAQAFNIYNTYTDASNYERGFMRWNANVLEIGNEKAGTGTIRTVRIGPKGANTTLQLGPNYDVSVGTNNLTLKCGATTILNANDFNTTLGSGSNAIYLSSASISLLSASISLPSIPTSDPAVAGRIWNDSGTLKISAG